MKNSLLTALFLVSASLHSYAAAPDSQETAQAYLALNTETVKDYLFSQRDLAGRLGGTPAKWKPRTSGGEGAGG